MSAWRSRPRGIMTGAAQASSLTFAGVLFVRPLFLRRAGGRGRTHRPGRSASHRSTTLTEYPAACSAGCFQVRSKRRESKARFRTPDALLDRASARPCQVVGSQIHTNFSGGAPAALASHSRADRALRGSFSVAFQPSWLPHRVRRASSRPCTASSARSQPQGRRDLEEEGGR